MTRRACLALLTALILLTFWPVHRADFVTFDDPAYVYQNPFIAHGLTWKGIQWAFQAGLTLHTSNSDHWQPVTWIFRMLEITFFGLHPVPHHVINVMLHLANTLLLFEVLRRMLQETFCSFWVAAIFAIHPMHVEAVAWVTALKDVLSGFFWMLCLWSWCRYAAHRSVPRYLAMLLFLLLTIMSKPIGMVLPFILILLDFWPLRRMPPLHLSWRTWLLEKIPLLVISILSALIALHAQGEHLRPSLHLGAVALSIVVYLWKCIVPLGLSVWHPAWKQISLTASIASIAFVLFISILVMGQRRARPHLLTGWFWFLITLLPVLSLREVAWAERYSYLPMIGLGMMAAWSLPEAARRKNGTAALAVLVLILACAARHQTRFWRDSVTLYERALAVAPDDFWIHNSLGVVWTQKKDYPQAERHFREAVRVQPDHATTYWNYGNMLMEARRPDEAIEQYQKAATLAPHNADMLASLASAYSAKGQLAKAVEQYRHALQIDPRSVKAACELGAIDTQLGNPDEAIQLYLKALEAEPENAALCNNMGNALLQQEKYKEAARYYLMAIAAAPALTSVRDNLGTALLFAGHIDEAIRVFRTSLKRDPNDVRAHYNLATCLIRSSEMEEGRDELEKAAALGPSPFADQARKDLQQGSKP